MDSYPRQADVTKSLPAHILSAAEIDLGNVTLYVLGGEDAGLEVGKLSTANLYIHQNFIPTESFEQQRIKH